MRTFHILDNISHQLRLELFQILDVSVQLSLMLQKLIQFFLTFDNLIRLALQCKQLMPFLVKRTDRYSLILQKNGKILFFCHWTINLLFLLYASLCYKTTASDYPINGHSLRSHPDQATPDPHAQNSRLHGRRDSRADPRSTLPRILAS